MRWSISTYFPCVVDSPCVARVRFAVVFFVSSEMSLAKCTPISRAFRSCVSPKCVRCLHVFIRRRSDPTNTAQKHSFFREHSFSDVFLPRTFGQWLTTASNARVRRSTRALPTSSAARRMTSRVAS